MVAIRIPLVLLAVTLGVGLASAVRAGKLIPYETVTIDGPNGHLDTSATASFGLCGNNSSTFPPGLGCFDRFGGFCSANSDTVCDLAVVPAGRCTRGSGACIWPQNAGVCVDGPGTIACLSDNGTVTGPSIMCRDADVGTSTDVCDMTGVMSACDCQGTDPSLATWEGLICGNVEQSVCSDGDPFREEGGERHEGGLVHGSAMCTDINIGGGAEIVRGCSNSSHTPGVREVKSMLENPAEFTTQNRRPGAGLALPNDGGPLLGGSATVVREIDEYGAGPYAKFGVRTMRTLGDSYHGDARFSADTVTDNFDSNLLILYCNAPRLYDVSRAIQGACTGGTCTGTEACGRNTDCNGSGTCSPGGSADCDFTPGAATTKYCHEAPFEGFGFLWTRDLTTGEHLLAQTVPVCSGANVCVGGGLDGAPCAVAADCGTSSCPPSCGNAVDLHTGEAAQISAFLEEVPAADGARASAQLALDNLEGQRMGRGGFISVQPLVSLSWVVLGDHRCFIGGNPDVVNSVCTGSCGGGGVCDSGVLTGSPCGVDADCQRCGDGVSECDSALSLVCAEMIGQCDDDTGRACDPFKGGAAGGCGGSPCRVCGGTPASPPVDLAVGGEAAHFDPIDGSDSPPLPIGYDSHGFAELDLVAGERMSVMAGVGATLRIPITLVSTNYAARAEMRDDGTSGLFDDDTLAPGSNAPTGIGAGGSYPVGSLFNVDPTGPASVNAVTWAAESSMSLAPAVVADNGPGRDDEGSETEFALNLTGTAGGAPFAVCKAEVVADSVPGDLTRLARVAERIGDDAARPDELRLRADR